jgi:putative ABC transport system ATP-binding protein
MSLIVAKSLSKTYATDSVEVKALQEVSFEIEAGAFLAFIGPSGSGKTTLLNLIGCLDKPTGGGLKSGAPSEEGLELFTSSINHQEGQPASDCADQSIKQDKI